MAHAFRLLAIAAALAATGTQAATLAVGAGWSFFGFGDTGSAIYDVATNDPSYDFTLTTKAYLDATDAYVIGDVFSFYNGSTLIGTTGAFDTSGPETTDPYVAFSGPYYSKGHFLLTPGTYSVTGIAATSCCGSGGAFIRLAAASGTPEPAAWALMIAGFGLVGTALRRRAATAIAAA